MKEIYYKIKSFFLIKAILRLIDNYGIEFSGYLAYLNILSIFPFLFILISTISIIDQTKSGIVFINYFFSIMPPYLIDILRPQINDLLSGPPSSLLSFAFLGAIWTASSSVEALRQIFNKIYSVKSPPNIIAGRIKSIFQFISAILAILLSMIIFLLIPQIFTLVEKHLYIPMPNLGSPIFRYTIVSCIIILSISSLYYGLTNRVLKFIQVLPGSIVAFVIWYLSSQALSFYITNFHQVSITYGSVATIIITLIFFYIINLALLFGAEINYQLLKVNKS
jgi:membrane protein